MGAPGVLREDVFNYNASTELTKESISKKLDWNRYDCFLYVWQSKQSKNDIDTSNKANMNLSKFSAQNSVVLRSLVNFQISGVVIQSGYFTKMVPFNLTAECKYFILITLVEGCVANACIGVLSLDWHKDSLLHNKFHL